MPRIIPHWVYIYSKICWIISQTFLYYLKMCTYECVCGHVCEHVPLCLICSHVQVSLVQCEKPS